MKDPPIDAHIRKAEPAASRSATAQLPICCKPYAAHHIGCLTVLAARMPVL
jgi:hypothetical protein